PTVALRAVASLEPLVRPTRLVDAFLDQIALGQVEGDHTQRRAALRHGPEPPQQTDDFGGLITSAGYLRCPPASSLPGRKSGTSARFTCSRRCWMLVRSRRSRSASSAGPA